MSWDNDPGHAFGLEHNFVGNAFIMSYGDDPRTLSPCYTSMLSVHPYFNSNVPTELTPPAIGLLPVQYESLHQQVSILVVTGSRAGLHHAMLYVMTMEPHDAAGQYELKECRL